MKNAQTCGKQLEEERFRLEKDLARLEARFDASLQQLKDREEVHTVPMYEQVFIDHCHYLLTVKQMSINIIMNIHVHFFFYEIIISMKNH